MSSLFNTISNILTSFFIVYLIIYSTFLFFSVVVGANIMFTNKKKNCYKNELDNQSFIPISIIVPAHNEEVTIIETIKSLLALDYRNYEIIVVDDGSTDNTSKVVYEHFDMIETPRPIQRKINCQPVEKIYECFNQKVKLSLIRKKNGGKADALNMGINAAYYSYFICMDADSILQYDSLKKIVNPILEDNTVVAAGGAIMLCNGVNIKNGRITDYDLPKNIYACTQAVEYTRSFLAARLLFDKFNGNLIISGAFGIFKKDIVIAAGGYDKNTKGEDMELVVKLHEFCYLNKIPYKIKYAPDAVCWTQAPEKLKDLKTQRKRWYLGLFQCMTKYRSFFASFSRGPVATISYLYFLIYELLSPFIELLGILLTVFIVFTNALNIGFAILFMLIYAVFGTVLSLTAYFTTIHVQGLEFKFKNIFKIIFVSIFETVFIHFFMLFTKATAFFGYKKNKRSWGNIERKRINTD